MTTFVTNKRVGRLLTTTFRRGTNLRKSTVLVLDRDFTPPPEHIDDALRRFAETPDGWKSRLWMVTNLKNSQALSLTIEHDPDDPTPWTFPSGRVFPRCRSFAVQVGWRKTAVQVRALW